VGFKHFVFDLENWRFFVRAKNKFQNRLFAVFSAIREGHCGEERRIKKGGRHLANALAPPDWRVPTSPARNVSVASHYGCGVNCEKGGQRETKGFKK